MRAANCLYKGTIVAAITGLPKLQQFGGHRCVPAQVASILIGPFLRVFIQK